MSSVAGMLCRCGRDEAGTSFIYITHPELSGYMFCNHCGSVYPSAGGDEPDEVATEKFKVLGMPEFDGQGLVSDPHEMDGYELAEPMIVLPTILFFTFRDPARPSGPVVVVAEVTQMRMLLRWVPETEFWEHAEELENDYLYGDDGGIYEAISADEAEQLMRDLAVYNERHTQEKLH